MIMTQRLDLTEIALQLFGVLFQQCVQKYFQIYYISNIVVDSQ